MLSYSKQDTTVTFHDDGTVETIVRQHRRVHEFPTFVTAMYHGEARSFFIDSPEDFRMFLSERGYERKRL